MRGHLDTSMNQRLDALDQEIRKRASLATFGYSFAIVAVIALYIFFPFKLSRVGSVVMIVALAHMIWKVYDASRERNWREDEEVSGGDIGKVDAQIHLIQSMLFNLPFLVGANLFWMGLPGTGSPVTKAWMDCWFLAGTVVIFGAFYLANQQTVRRELLPLRAELAAVVVQPSE
jgi:hypothetical protein